MGHRQLVAQSYTRSNTLSPSLPPNRPERATHFESFFEPNLIGLSDEMRRPLVRTCSTTSLMLVEAKTVSSSCFEGRLRRPCEPAAVEACGVR